MGIHETSQDSVEKGLKYRELPLFYRDRLEFNRAQSSEFSKKALKNKGFLIMDFSNLKLSVLNLAPVRQGYDNAQAVQAMTELAQAVEQMGYDRYWIAEHHNIPGLVSSATSILIAHVLQNTQKIRVGSGGIMLPNHSPLVVAEQFGTLATIYPNRVDLGLGRAPGTDRMTAAALRRTHQETALSFPDDVQALQRYLGDDSMQGYVKAYPGMGTNVPIYILGSSTESAYLAAALGLPYAFAAHFAPRMLESAAQIYRQNFRPSAVLDKPYFILACNLISTETDEEAQWLSTSHYHLVLSIVRNSRLPLMPPRELPTDLSESERQVVESMTAYTLRGSKATITAQLESWQNILRADELMAVSYIYDQEKQKAAYQTLKDICS